MEPTDLQTETLTGGLRDALLMRVRQLKRPWSMLTEDEQRNLADELEGVAEHLVRQAVSLVSDYEWPRVDARLGDVKITGGDKPIDAKIAVENTEVHRTALGDHVGDKCVILMVDPETFHGEREAARVDPDQPTLPGAGDDDR